LNTIILSTDKLSKYFGSIKAVNKLSLEINKGSVFGILGPNGSGKTTLLGLILDVINVTDGTYKWFGQHSAKIKRRKIGALLETPNFYPYLSAEKNLEIIAEIKKVSYEEIQKVLKSVNLEHRKRNKFSTYSLGMKQRLAIAAALLGDPDVLILDEPTNGLDPQGIAEIRDIILKVAKKGITIILASHLLDEVQKVCTDVLVLKQGKSLFLGKVNEMCKDSVIIELAGEDKQIIKKILKNFSYITNIQEDGNLLLVEMKEGVSTLELNQFLIKNKIIVSHIAQRKKSLENYFLKLLAESDD
jgi:ABC-2 type transport system ATP-binding protein